MQLLTTIEENLLNTDQNDDTEFTTVTPNRPTTEEPDQNERVFYDALWIFFLSAAGLIVGMVLIGFWRSQKG